MAIKRADFPLPDVDDEVTAPFFAAAARSELAIPKCNTCGAFVWYPDPTCSACGGSDQSWVAVSGRGTLFSWVVVRRAFLPAFEDKVPFVSALVALDEDPAVRIVSYVVDVEPDALQADMPLAVAFRPLRFPTVPDHSVVVPMFTAAAGA